jgi:hypothetical protein
MKDCPYSVLSFGEILRLSVWVYLRQQPCTRCKFTYKEERERSVQPPVDKLAEQANIHLGCKHESIHLLLYRYTSLQHVHRS